MKTEDELVKDKILELRRLATKEQEIRNYLMMSEEERDVHDKERMRKGWDDEIRMLEKRAAIRTNYGQGWDYI